MGFTNRSNSHVQESERCIVNWIAKCTFVYAVAFIELPSGMPIYSVKQTVCQVNAQVVSGVKSLQPSPWEKMKPTSKLAFRMLLIDTR